MITKTYLTIKSLGTVGITFQYLILSFIYPSRFTELKKKWAFRLLEYIGYEVHSAGKPLNAGPCIYVGNHISYLDILVLMSVHPQICFLAKKEIKYWPIIGIAAIRAGTLFVDRESKKDRSKLRKQIGEQLYQKKAHVVVFPSGTTTMHEEKIWKKGIFEIAQDYQIPVQLFKVDYHPLEESSYVGDVSLIEKMNEQLSVHPKKANLHWLENIKISHPENDAENLRSKVRRHQPEREL